MLNPKDLTPADVHVYVRRCSLFLIVTGRVMGGESMGEPIWRRARRCEGGACVEIGNLGKLIVVRSSADPDGTSISLERDEWREFVAGVKDGDFDGL
jgi:hypothetical protein